MKINKLDSEEIKVRKMLYNVQGYMDKARINKSVNQKKFSNDLHVIGKKCRTPEKQNILNNCLIALAERMINLKQDNLAGIIYSFLIKFNKDNLVVLKQLIPKALEIAQKQNDVVHIAARTGELCQIYRNTHIHGANYLACLNTRKNALQNICLNYDKAKEKYRTVSRQISTKDMYIELLIKTKIDIANELASTNKCDARNELLSAYKDLSQFSNDYRLDPEKSYSTLKKHISIASTNIMLDKKSKNIGSVEQFETIRQNIINATKKREPIENSIFNDYISSTYDAFKNNSQEEKFIDRAIEFVNDLSNAGNPILTDKVFTILTDKNKSNIKNLKTVIMAQLEARERANDNFGVLRYSTTLQKLFKQDPKAVTISTYIKSIQININALTNIINNYDKLNIKNYKLRPKDEYIEQLIFAKVNSAKLHKNTSPAYYKQTIQEAGKLIDGLPAGFVSKHPEMRKLVDFVMQNVD